MQSGAGVRRRQEQVLRQLYAQYQRGELAFRAVNYFPTQLHLSNRTKLFQYSD